jgi:exodeoxyribonuclease III
MRVATWNINGVRAREAQLLAWLDAEKPDVACLQEIKASLDQVPASLLARDDYWSCWHGEGGYSGVALLLKKSTFPAAPTFEHPPFDMERRIVLAKVEDGRRFASLYVPNGGKDFPAKMAFLDALTAWLASLSKQGHGLLLAGDMNVTRSDIDVHPSQRKPDVIGQRPDERASFARLFDPAEGAMLDAQRVLEPTADRLFTWWPYWKTARKNNLGWRIDYVLYNASFAQAPSAAVIAREYGTSDHAPLIVTFG